MAQPPPVRSRYNHGGATPLAAVASAELRPFPDESSSVTVGYAFRRGLCEWDDTCPRSGATSQVPCKADLNDGSISMPSSPATPPLPPTSVDLQIAAGLLQRRRSPSRHRDGPSHRIVQCALSARSTGNPARQRRSDVGERPEMVECHYRLAVGVDATLVVWFHCKTLSHRRIWIRAICENGYLTARPTRPTYPP